MIKSTSTIRTLAIAMLLLVFHLAFNRTPHHVTSFSFDQHVAPDSRAGVGVPSTHHHVVGIHRPVPLQLRDQQQQQQQHRSILLADSILFQTLSDSTKQHNDLRTTTPIMTMSEKALTPQWKSNDELLESKKMIFSSFLNHMFSPITFIRAYQMSISMRRRNTTGKYVISWVDAGTAFQIHDRDLVIPILEKYFNMSKYKSFLRQLQAYGFQRATLNPSTDEEEAAAADRAAAAAAVTTTTTNDGSQGGDRKQLELPPSKTYSKSRPRLKATHRGKWHHTLFRRDKMNLCNKMTQMIIIIVSSMITIVANMITFFIKMNNKK